MDETLAWVVDGQFVLTKEGEKLVMDSPEVETLVAVELLTEDEKRAIELAGECASLIFKIIKENGGFEHDADEICTAVHVLQRFVMSNAAARAYPGKYRMLGADSSHG